MRLSAVTSAIRAIEPREISGTVRSVRGLVLAVDQLPLDHRQHAAEPLQRQPGEGQEQLAAGAGALCRRLGAHADSMSRTTAAASGLVT